MDADTRAKLAEGVKLMMLAAYAGEETTVHSGNPSGHRGRWLFSTTVQTYLSMGTMPPLPPLTLTQTLGLRLLLGDTDPGLCAAAVDAMVEAGLIPADQLALIRLAERATVYAELVGGGG